MIPVRELPMVFLIEKQNILVHARGRMTPFETDFWQRLRKELNGQGYELWLIGHHLAQQPMEVPLIKAPNGLDAFPRADINTGWSSWLPLTGTLNENELLECEGIWWGAPTTPAQKEGRRRALYYFKNFYTSVLKVIKPVLTVIWNGHHPQEIILDGLCRESGCQLVYIERGPFYGTIQVDKSGVLGGSTVATESSWKWQSAAEQSRWLATMDEIISRYATKRATWWEQPQTAGPDSVRKRFNIRPDTKVVLFAGQVDEDIQSILYSPLFPTNLSALKWLCESVKGDETVFILGKQHPKSSTPIASYQSILDGRGFWVDDVSLEDCLSVADRVVAVNSTVLQEALMVGKPTLSMGTSLLTGKHICYEVSSLFDVNVISDWLEAKGFPERYEKWRDFSAYLLAHSLFTMCTDAESLSQRGAKELAECLSSMATTGSQCSFENLAFDSALIYFMENICASGQIASIPSLATTGTSAASAYEVAHPGPLKTIIDALRFFRIR